jgi:hypothetical protein
MAVPDEAGTHRVNWDLRHGDPDQPDTWGRFDEPGYTRNARQSSQATVSPGTYQVTLVARGVESSQPVWVVGDPLLELTDEDYRATEEFLLGVRALSNQVLDAISEASEEDAEALRELQRQIREMERRVGNAGRFNDGNFGPPSAADQAKLEELEEEATRLMGG